MAVLPDVAVDVAVTILIPAVGFADTVDVISPAVFDAVPFAPFQHQATTS